MLELDALDGKALLGYGGLGCTAMGTEPGDWMARVLRGRNHTLLDSLKVLMLAMVKEFPRHLEALEVQDHCVVASAFHNNRPCIMSLNLTIGPAKGQYKYSGNKHLLSFQGGRIQVDSRLAMYGSGVAYRSPVIERHLLNMVAALDNGRVSAELVAGEFARYNSFVADATESVGSSAIVAWRFRKGGGAQLLFERTQAITPTKWVHIPLIVNGIDMNEIVRAMEPYLSRPPGDPLQLTEAEEALVDSARKCVQLGPVEKLK